MQRLSSVRYGRLSKGFKPPSNVSGTNDSRRILSVLIFATPVLGEDADCGSSLVIALGADQGLECFRDGSGLFCGVQ
jgi:hypothetical protein